MADYVKASDEGKSAHHGGRDYNKYPKLNPDNYPDLTGMVETSEDKVRENSLEEEIDLLDHQTRQLNDLMQDINRTRNRIYTKRMQNDEKEAKLSASINNILHGDATEAPMAERTKW